VSPSKSLPPHSSFESLRKQAKKLAREFAAGDSDALARVHALLPVPELPFRLRDAQLVLAREYGFAGWHDLRAMVLRQEGKGLEWAAAEAESAIHDYSVERLAQLIEEYPALISWCDDSGKTLLKFATESFGDSGLPFTEEHFTRAECAEFLLDRGAAMEPEIWEGAIRSHARGLLGLFQRKGVLPRTLNTMTALGDLDGVREFLPGADRDAVMQAFYFSCRFHHREVAALLLDRYFDLDPVLGEQVEKWRGRAGFLDYMLEHGAESKDPWLAVVTKELERAMHNNDLEEYNRWLEREPALLDESNLGIMVHLLEIAVYNNREPFVRRLLEFVPAMKTKRPPCGAVGFAVEYGYAYMLPLLTPIWPLPDDLPHAAGAGDFAGVKKWFDEAGRLKLGSLAQHHPTNNPGALRNLHWIPGNAQHVLDVAFAWACVNKHFEIAEFLLARGANVNTDWNTHEPASVLHHCAITGNYEAAQFLIDHGIDMTIRDYRWSGTAEGWAIHAFSFGQPPIGDTNMAEFLANAERARNERGTV